MPSSADNFAFSRTTELKPRVGRSGAQPRRETTVLFFDSHRRITQGTKANRKVSELAAERGEHTILRNGINAKREYGAVDKWSEVCRHFRKKIRGPRATQYEPIPSANGKA